MGFLVPRGSFGYSWKTPSHRDSASQGEMPVSPRFPSWLGLSALVFLVPLGGTGQEKFVGKPEGKKVALLVGVKKYKKDQLSDLKFTENDVSDLASLLKLDGYHRVVLMTERAGADDPDL